MLTDASLFAARTPLASFGALAAPAGQPSAAGQEDVTHARHIGEQLALVERSVAIQRRIVRAGEAVYQAGTRFTHLYIVNAGFFKVVSLSSDGREQIVSLQYRGDWLGFDGIAEGSHDCDAFALDTGEVWAISYAALLQAGAGQPALMGVLHQAMSREIAHDRSSLLSVCTLPADARVADFLHTWAGALSSRGLRTDQMTMRMTRAEIGNYLGVTLETVSRALSRLDRSGLIRFLDKGRRELRIPDVGALGEFVQGNLAPAATLQ